jgi:hypothetical protein
VIEDVEGFGPEFKVLALGDGEVLEQGHIEVSPPGIVQNIPSGVAESQASGGYEHGGVEKKRPITRLRKILNSGPWVPDKVWI